MSVQNINAKSKLIFPVNVRILHTNNAGMLLNDLTVKNMVLKEYGLYSWVRFILGDFNNNQLIDEGQYIPKYLAVGSNTSTLNGAPGTGTSVDVTNISLYHELLNYDRIALNRVNYVEDYENEPYLKIQYEAYIPEDKYVNETIGELALMTGKTGWNAFARITGFEPFVKTANSVVQVIWEITIISLESANRFIPVNKQFLLECIEKSIDILQSITIDPEGLTDARLELNKLLQPSDIPNTALYYLLNNNEQITQDVVNNFLSKPFNSVTDTGLIPLIHKFDPEWNPSGPIII